MVVSFSVYFSIGALYVGLILITVKNTEAKVITREGPIEEFLVDKGVRQGQQYYSTLLWIK